MASLADINKTLQEQTSAIEYGNRGTDDLRMKFGAFVDGIKGGAGDRREQEIEAARQNSRVKAAGPRGMSRGFGKGIGGLGGLGKIAGVAGMLGIAGLAAMQFLDGEKIKQNVESILSIGERYNENTLKTLFSDGAVIVALKALGTGLLVFAAGGAASAGVNALDKATMDKFELSTGWSQNVKDNVTTLLSISDGLGESVKTLAKGLIFAPAMLGLTAGLAVFAAGSTLAVGNEAFTQWVGAGNWAENIKSNVITLLSISDELGGNVEMLKKGGTFGVAMLAVGAGLAAFAGAQGISVVGEAFKKFAGAEDWATKVKENVKILLGIGDTVAGSNTEMLKKAGTFFVAMTGIAAGLTAFAAGAALGTAGDGVAQYFMGENATGDAQLWSQTIVDNVTNLLSITQLGIGKFVGFAGAMTAIGAGLVAFAAAGTGASILDSFSDWIAPGEGRQDWAQNIKNKVTTLLSLVDGESRLQNAKDFSSAMGSISAGLLKFTTSNFIGGMQNAITAIGSFFTGAESPFSQVMQIANNADDLDTGAKAVDSLTVSIEKLGKLKFDGRSINMKEFALDLAESIKVIETAVNGGTFDASWLPFTDQKIEGLSSPDVDYDAAIRNVENLRAALRVGVNPNDITDRYGNTFMLPTNMSTVPRSYGSGRTDFSAEMISQLQPEGTALYDPLRPNRIRPGFESNALDAIADNNLVLRRMNGQQSVFIDSSTTNNNDNSNNSSQNVVTTGPLTDPFSLHQ